MKIWRMRIPCWIPKATYTHSEYVTIFCFSTATMVARRQLTVTFVRLLPVMFKSNVSWTTNVNHLVNFVYPQWSQTSPHHHHLSKHVKCHGLLTRCWDLRDVREKHLRCNKLGHYFVHCQWLSVFSKVTVKVEFTLEQATKGQRGSRGIALLFLQHRR